MFIIDYHKYQKHPHNKSLNKKHKMGHGAHNRIINGEVATKHQFPWMAAIYRLGINQNKNPLEYDVTTCPYHCGGSILTENVILTAAQCIYYYIPFTRVALNKFPAKALGVLVGQTDIKVGDKKLIGVKLYHCHPQFNTVTYHNDIAILILQETIRLNVPGVSAIPMCPQYVGVGVSVTVAGWGTTCHAYIDRFHLRHATMTTIDTNSCYELTENNDNASIICTGPDTYTGHGDSGSGLYRRNDSRTYLVGITSVSKSCTNLKAPQSFTRMSTYVHWVQQMMTYQ